ncbi:MAG: nuclear transport factor 2 family protein [Woeseiaceae bacterium]
MSSAIALLAACTLLDDPTTHDILAAREMFNQAIVDGEIETIRRVLATDVMLVAGSDSAVLHGRDAQLQVWQADFDSGDRLVYERTAQCIRPSPIFPIAMEAGVWRGSVDGDRENYVSGEYSAKWRLIDGTWQLEAETFVTTDCGGSMCPDERIQ